MNHIPTKFLYNKSSYEVMYDATPDMSLLRVFGCLIYASTFPNNIYG